MPIDYKKYPKDWKEIRKRILKRAKNKCEFCGLKNGTIVYRARINKKVEWYKTLKQLNKAVPQIEMFDFYKKYTAKVVLTIAHLDHDETNHNVKDDRLRALCQLCHLRYDAKEKYRRRILKQI
jgi:uncharacterized protein YdaT